MRRVALAALLIAVAGCGGPKLVPVTGKVTEKGGKAVTAGSVWLHPAEGNPWKGERPSCQLALDGQFTLRTYPHGDGVPPGEWKVTLSPELANRLKKPDHADPAKSPWKITVPDAGVAGHVLEVE